MISIPITRLLTNKSNVGQTVVDKTAMSSELHAGEVLLTVDTFALTSNNITYAAFGEAMRYWEFFPTDKDGWGHMPVWGFGTVHSSAAGDIAPGERFYGYFPIASLLKVQADRITPRGFQDTSAHRRDLPFVYNAYVRQPPGQQSPELDDAEMLMRPLFYTSYMLADFLADNGFFGAEQIIISSASSKTAYGTAFCLEPLTKRPPLIGLTSARNREFVASLGLYDEAAIYGELQSLPSDKKTLYVDFSGSTALRNDVHTTFAGNLVYDCYAGSATNTDYLDGATALQPEPAAFFAPTQIRKRIRDWGSETLTRRYEDVQQRFLARLIEPKKPWMHVQPGYGFGDAARIVRTLHMSGDQPHLGRVIRLDMLP